jgi:cytochrome b561
MNVASLTRGSAVRHPSWVIVLHWVTVSFLLIGVAAILVRGLLTDRELKTALLVVHRGAGLLVLAVTLLRILTTPWIRVREPLLTTWERWGSMFSHLAIYLLLIANPILGWLLTSARGQTAYFMGAIPLPALTGRDRDYADQLEGLHLQVAIVLLVVVALHSGGALWHHYYRRDLVLRRMLPVVGKSRRT